MRIDEAADLLARINRMNSGNELIQARQACAEGRRDEVLQLLKELPSVDNNNIADKWLILMMLGEKQAATELLHFIDSNGVPYQLASWLIYHTFDPAPFPSLIQMLKRENVTRPPAAEIPFACPAE